MSRNVIISLVCAAILGIGWLDYVTGPDLAFALFYILPIAICGWWSGRVGGIIAALVGSLTWFTVGLYTETGHSMPVIVWNATTRLGIFLFVGLMIATARRDRRRISAANDKLRVLLEEADRLARTDAKTGLPNSRAFFETLESELARAQRSGQPIAIAYLDVDHFKEVNDFYGHDAGDVLLGELAHAIKESIRLGDLAARLGGDEFILLLRDASLEGVEEVAQRLLQRVARCAAQYPKSALGMSVGVAYFSKAPVNGTEAVRRADAAMYGSKRAGRGRVTLWTDQEEQTA
ncbi:MAG: diguanylate cyclase [Myxococcota bacterium]